VFFWNLVTMEENQKILRKDFIDSIYFFNFFCFQVSRLQRTSNVGVNYHDGLNL
jgi:hypothetical protein